MSAKAFVPTARAGRIPKKARVEEGVEGGSLLQVLGAVEVDLLQRWVPGLHHHAAQGARAPRPRHPDAGGGQQRRPQAFHCRAEHLAEEGEGGGGAGGAGGGREVGEGGGGGAGQPAAPHGPPAGQGAEHQGLEPEAQLGAGPDQALAARQLQLQPRGLRREVPPQEAAHPQPRPAQPGGPPPHPGVHLHRHLHLHLPLHLHTAPCTCSR